MPVLEQHVLRRCWPRPEDSLTAPVYLARLRAFQVVLHVKKSHDLRRSHPEHVDATKARAQLDRRHDLLLQLRHKQFARLQRTDVREQPGRPTQKLLQVSKTAARIHPGQLNLTSTNLSQQINCYKHIHTWPTVGGFVVFCGGFFKDGLCMNTTAVSPSLVDTVVVFM